MIGIDIIGALMMRDAAVIDFATSEGIKAGRLPESVILPAYLVRLISLIDYQPLKGSRMVRSTARIRVTVRAASYDDQVEGIRLVRAACARFTGDIANAKRVSVLTAGTGPDLNGPGNSFEQSQDFRVTFDAAA